MNMMKFLLITKMWGIETEPRPFGAETSQAPKGKSPRMAV